jgi:hypothetical protein
MTGVMLLVLTAAAVYLIMRRRGRVFLEREEAYVIAVTFILCMVQKAFIQYVSLSDIFVTPFYISIVICAGHAGGSDKGAVCGFFTALVISLCALAFTGFDTGDLPARHIPLQYVVIMVMWMIIGAAAGTRLIPKPAKPFIAGLWLFLVAAYSPHYLRNLSAYIIVFGAVALSALGLYLNLFKRSGVSTVYYPTSPSRRTGM